MDMEDICSRIKLEVAADWSTASTIDLRSASDWSNRRQPSALLPASSSPGPGATVPWGPHQGVTE